MRVHVNNRLIMAMRPFCLYLLALSFCPVVKATAAQVQVDVLDALDQVRLPTPEVFLDDLVHEYGSGGKLSVDELENLLVKLNVGGIRRKTAIAAGDDQSGFNVQNQREATLQSQSQLMRVADASRREKSLEMSKQCYSTSEIMQIHNLEPTSEVDQKKMSEMCPVILQQIGMGCGSDGGREEEEEEEEARLDGDESAGEEILMFEDVWLRRVLRSVENNTDDDTSPTTAQVWGYSFVCVTIINLCSLVGVLVVPFMNKKYYQTILMFLICLAVGTLSGSSLLHLLPEAHGLTPDIEYLLKNLTVIGGIYLFFLTEKILKIFIVRKKRLADEKAKENSGGEAPDIMPICSITAKPGHGEHRIIEPVELAAEHHHHHHHHHHHENENHDKPKCIDGSEESGVVLVVDENGTRVFETPLQEKDLNGENQDNGTINNMHEHKACAHTVLAEDQSIATVAYMVIFGDGLHNFIDGLTIGAAFTVSVLGGISICIAILCEEFPHELGDFAILLNAGMSVKRALCYNFLSACMCYLGVVCGILLAEHTEGAEWIFAIAAGMFLYISLVDMLPEINTVEERETNMSGAAQAKIFLVQNLGLLTGWAAMLVLGVFETHIVL